MTPLTPQEIAKIPPLLLHEDPINVDLAIALLQQHPNAVDALQIPLEIAGLALHRAHQNAILTLLQQVDDQYNWSQSPLYLLHRLANEQQAREEHRPIIWHFVQAEPRYRPWLLEHPQLVFSYANIAQFLVPLEDFRATAFTYYDWVVQRMPQLPISAFVYQSYAEALRDYPPLMLEDNVRHSAVLKHYQNSYHLLPKRSLLTGIADYHLHHRQDVERARSVWKTCLSLYPKDPSVYLGYLTMEMQQEDWDRAWAISQHLLEKHRDDFNVFGDRLYYKIGLVAWKGNKAPEKAAYYFEQALEENRFSPEPLQALMELSLKQDDRRAAIRWHKMALEQAPFDVTILMELGDLHANIGDKDQARLYYRDVLQLNADYIPALEGMAQLGDTTL